MKMRKISTIKLDPEIYKQLATVRMSHYERTMAIGAARNAEAILDGLAWIIDIFENLGQRLSTRRVATRPSFKH